MAEPLDNHPRYVKVSNLNSGTFGFVQLAFDKQSQQHVAIKFMYAFLGHPGTLHCMPDAIDRSVTCMVSIATTSDLVCTGSEELGLARE